jgi:signal transduction histidine kinase
MDNREASGSTEQVVQLSLPTKVFLGFTTIVILFASVLAFNFTRLGDLYGEVTIINRGFVPLRLTLSEMQGRVGRYSVLLAERDPVVLRTTLAASQGFDQFFQRIENRLGSHLETIAHLELQASPLEQSTLFTDLQRFLEELKRRNRELIDGFDTLQSTVNWEDVGQFENHRIVLREDFRRTEQLIFLLNGKMEVLVSGALDRVGRHHQRNLLIVLVTTAGAMFIGLLAIFWTARILRPLTQLTEGVKKLREGEYETVDVTAHNEIGVLATEFNQMVAALEERDHKLRAGRIALERAHKVALHAEKLATIGRLTSQITHEIRNPLSSIALNVELLEESLVDRGLGDKESLSTMKAIVDEIDRLTGITQEYLQFARLPEPIIQEESINEVIKTLVDFHGEIFRRGRTEVSLRLADELPLLKIDEGQLRQALLNLLFNACEAMPEGGTVEVETQLSGDQVMVTIRDEGTGINVENSRLVFDPFYTTKAQGTGLGLPLCAQIISQHSGEINCRSSEEGGTVFTITLPVDRLRHDET